MQIQSQYEAPNFRKLLREHGSKISTEGHLQRLELKITNCNRFRPKANDNFNLQYNNIYLSRYNQLKNSFIGKDFKQISSLEGEGLIRGVIKKNYKNKMSIVNKIININDKEAKLDYLYSLDDDIEIEDDTGKVKIQVNKTTTFSFPIETDLKKEEYTINDLAYGIVVAIRGSLNRKINKFVCQTVYFPSLTAKQNLTKQVKLQPTDLVNSADQLLLLASSLRISQQSNDYAVLKNFVEGKVGGSKIRNIMKCVKTVVIAGELLKRDNNTKLRRQDYQILDNCLYQMKQSINTCVMQGKNDFLSGLWVKQPLNPILFPKSVKFVIRASNPEIFSVGNTTILGSTGENIEQLRRTTSISETTIGLMEYQILSRHIASNAPSTLKCPPYQSDPFVLKDIPNVYFCGSSEKYATKLLRIDNSFCRLISVPEFKECIVLINPKTLATFSMSLY